ncbi:NAD(P)-dependent oxidoreductase [Amylibacter ulvae]|uniref:NAD(P)-dependent oxidoreductase n=1 Tax=Paramylibacter ulvae TaxID=1651968 RepID=A0ABQ3CX05_9RHOB|nr:SDR family oxidoreductase [Amylibacter ulvae]GHA47489.1 NAD(P)-dependent oxidoreductase [Amylibacter ulvae]
MSKILLSIGHGYSARAIACGLIGDGWTIYATTRSVEQARVLQGEGVIPIIWPDTDLTPFITKATHIVSSVAPDEHGDAVLNAYSDEIAAQKDRLEWVGYLSTTGVYGDHDGGWVDEETPLNPTTQRGKYRQAAEQEWQTLGLPLVIFRLAGIYGVGRGPFSKLRAGTARCIVKKNQVFSRIHVDDIAQVVIASMRNPDAGNVFNVCDDDAAPPQDVIAYGAKLLGIPAPIPEDFETADMRPMARSFYAESKRVRNDRIKRALGVTLKFPDYKTGLQALLKTETAPE